MAAPLRQISVTLPAAVWAELAARARATGVTVDALIQAAVRADLVAAGPRRRRRKPARNK